MKTWCLLSLVCLVSVGCAKRSGPPGLATVPVTGTVTLDGSPLVGADVAFLPDDSPTFFAGHTGADGSYQLQCLKGREAALKGHCKVTVSRLVKPDGSPLSGDETPASVGATEQLPEKYAQMDMTTLSADVTDGGGKFDFPLTSR